MEVSGLNTACQAYRAESDTYPQHVSFQGIWQYTFFRAGRNLPHGEKIGARTMGLLLLLDNEEEMAKKGSTVSYNQNQN